MKKLLTILFTISLLLLPSLPLYAQQEESNEVVIEEQNTEEETETLADQLEEKTVEDIQPKPISFFTILAAILIPSIFIIIAYLILKFFRV